METRRDPNEFTPPADAGCARLRQFKAATRSWALLGSLLLFLATLCSCSSKPAQAPSSASLSNPEATPVQLLELGNELQLADSIVEALGAYDSCIARAGRLPGEEPVLARGLLARARLSLLLNLYARAAADADSALRLQRRAAHTPVERGSAWLFLAGGLEGERKLPQADSASDSALASLSKLVPPDTGLHVDALILRGRVLLSLDRPGDAEGLYTTATHLCSGEARTERLWEAQSLLGLCMARQGRLEEAEPLLLRAFLGFSETLGNEDPLTRSAAATVAELYERWQKHDLAAHYGGIATHSEHADEE